MIHLLIRDTGNNVLSNFGLEYVYLTTRFFPTHYTEKEALWFVKLAPLRR